MYKVTRNLFRTSVHQCISRSASTEMVKAKKFILVKHFDGFPKETDLKIVEEELPSIKNGEFLTEAVYLSVDPYMRPYSRNIPEGSTFIGTQVAKIIESKNTSFPVGKYVVGNYGWRNYTIAAGTEVENGAPITFLLPDLQGIPLSYALGILGMPGNTAYFGLLELCKPQKGETVVVTAAAGAVGSTVGQIAKIKGCKVIGVVGSDDKGKWIVDDLKFDHFVNYKSADFKETLAKYTPNGVDCYFDNVGGEISSAIIQRMNKFGRIAACGVISSYHDKTLPKVTSFQSVLVMQQLKMEGFIVYRWLDRWNEGILQNTEWIKSGQLKTKETITEGFDKTFKAFVEMLQGNNFGKAIVKA